jgi:pyroglutamyl-peptidase
MTQDTLVVVTAFGAFPGVRENPAELVLRTLRIEGLGDGVTAQFELLDSAYSSVSRRIADLLAERPAALVMVGFSRHATRLTLERRATNRRSSEHADEHGFLPQAAPPREVALDNRGVDFDKLLAALEGRGISAEVSDDAGDYVCNHCYFEALGAIIGVGLMTRAVFVHIPALEGSDQGAGTMPLARMVEGVRAVARELVR